MLACRKPQGGRQPAARQHGCLSPSPHLQLAAWPAMRPWPQAPPRARVATLPWTRRCKGMQVGGRCLQQPGTTRAWRGWMGRQQTMPWSDGGPWLRCQGGISRRFRWAAATTQHLLLTGNRWHSRSRPGISVTPGPQDTSTRHASRHLRSCDDVTAAIGRRLVSGAGAPCLSRSRRGSYVRHLEAHDQYGRRSADDGDPDGWVSTRDEG